MSKQQANTTYFYKTYGNDLDVTQHEYRLVLKTLFNLIRQSMIYEGKSYKLPHRLGELAVVEAKTSTNRYDYGHYHYTGEKIPIRNSHTENKTFRIIHTVRGVTYVDIFARIAKFKPVRAFAREFARALKEENVHHLYPKYEAHIN